MSQVDTDTLRRALLQDTEVSLAKLRSRMPAPRDILILLETELDRAQLLFALGEESTPVRQALARAAGAGQAAVLSQLRNEGPGEGSSVVLIEPEMPSRSVHIAALEFVLDHWIGAWSSAVMARDITSLRLLCSGEVIRASTPPAAIMHSVWGPHCQLLATTSVAPWQLESLERLLKEVLENAEGLAPDVRGVRIEPVLDLVRAMLERDGHAFAGIAAAAAASNRLFWANRDLPHHPRAVWPLEVTALTLLAIDNELLSVGDLKRLDTELPVSLIQSVAPLALSRTRVSWPLREILSSDEANWFLDLRGVPRQGREHQVLMHDDQLVAVYPVSSIMIPQGLAEFALVNELGKSDCQPALDAGELLLLAERLVGQAPPSSPNREARVAYHELITEALAAVDAVIARIPSGADRVPVSTLSSDTARRMMAGDPGRFRKVRIQAYRDGIATALAQFDRDGREQQSAALEQVKAAAEMISSSVTPLLEALAGESGTGTARTLVPGPDDFTAAFTPEAVKQAREGYLAYCPQLPEVDTLDYWLDIQVKAAAAGLLRSRNDLSVQFPEAYLKVADRLVAQNVWLTWRYVTDESGAGESYDGLVWLNGRWVWFPKPWRYFSGKTLH
ncbi:MAG: hypothetical protein GY703_16060 [Gammaproteobacteria bacterium]|nr:hypothetical protein [Gammaproteobacteria bacterium]